MREIDDAILRQVMPNAPRGRRTEFLPFINSAMAEFDIDHNELRTAAFLAQLAHESGELRWMEELASGSAYEGRASLGNTQPGDGKRFKGRGPIQLTGRSNYRRYGKLLGVDLEQNPALAATKEVGFRVAGQFWELNGLNELADRRKFKEITHRINGGYTHLKERVHYYEVALKAIPDDFGTGEERPTDEEHPDFEAHELAGPTVESVPAAAPKPENPAPQDVKVDQTVAVDTTSKKSFRVTLGAIGTAAGAWLTTNVGEAMGWVKNINTTELFKWLLIVAGAIAGLYLLRQTLKMLVTTAGTIAYNLMSMWSHANPATNNVKLASPAPQEIEK